MLQTNLQAKKKSKQAGTPKVGLSPPKILIFVSFNNGLLKMMKNAFYFILKALLLSRYLNFCLDFLGM